jgi:hypothetical protein
MGVSLPQRIVAGYLKLPWIVYPLGAKRCASISESIRGGWWVTEQADEVIKTRRFILESQPKPRTLWGKTSIG